MHEESLFGLAAPASMADDGNGGLNLGYTFYSDVDCELAAFRYYGYPYRGGDWSGAGFSGYWGVLWNSDGTVKLFVPFQRSKGEVPPAVDAWRNHWVHPRLPLVANVPYMLSIWMYHERYGYTAGLFNTTYQRGHLTVDRPTEGSPAGRFHYSGDIVRPTDISSAGYAVDIVVEVED